MSASARQPPIPLVKVAMPPAEQLMPALEAVLYSGQIGEGEQVYAFEAAFSQQFNLPGALAVSSGTAALHIALLLAGAAPGREVITTAMTAEPTNIAILQTGARPVFADVDPETGNLSPAAVAAAITPRTVAILVVHYAGYPADVAALRKLADSQGVQLIEDCAHALGASVEGKSVGRLGDSAIFSFQAIKHMTTGDGGMLVLRNEAQLGRAKRLRWFGLTRGVPRTEVDIVEFGYKYNMNNIAAIIGLVQLNFIHSLIDTHKQNGRFFDQELSGTPGLQPAKLIPNCDPSYWLYTLLADDADGVIAALESIGVTASKLHRPNHYHSVLAPFASELACLDRFYRRLVHIPCGWWLDAETRQQIVERLRQG